VRSWLFFAKLDHTPATDPHRSGRVHRAGDALLRGQSNFWAKISAMSVLGTLPIFVVVAFMQRYLVRGISLGAVKA
jgi:ABC-type glycerol-3-phosphate transport system permease component